MKLKPYLVALLHSYTFTELINQYASENADGFSATYSLQVAAFALHSGVDDHALPLVCLLAYLLLHQGILCLTPSHTGSC